MSCFIMSEENLQTLGATLADVMTHAFSVSADSVLLTDEPAKRLQTVFNDCKIDRYAYSANLMAYKLYRINKNAYAYRYHEPVVDAFPVCAHCEDKTLYQPAVRDGLRETVQPWHYKFAFLLDCWLYQTDEDATMQGPTRTALAAFATALKCAMVEHTPAYDGPWS